MSTIKFDHTKESFPEALGLDSHDVDQLAQSLATTMEYVVKNKPSRSEIAEVIANTFSFTEILMLATDGLHAKLEEAIIDPTDIDGSLDRANVPDEIRAEIKLRILKEMRDKLRDQED